LGQDSILVNVINVYLPCEFYEKASLWEEIVNTKEEEGRNLWCLVEYFNEVRSTEERKGVNQVGCRREIQGFNVFINRLEVLDISWLVENITDIHYKKNMK